MFRYIPRWSIVLLCLLLASVVAERAKAEPRAHRIVIGNGLAFALRFDRVVSHTASLGRLPGTPSSIPGRRQLSVTPVLEPVRECPGFSG